MTSKRQEFKVDALIIFGERVKEAIDAKRYLLELSLFEDLDVPYISGQVVLMDDSGMFDRLALMGTEQIYFSIVGQDDDTRLNITMNIVSIVNRTKTNDRVEVYHLNLVSPVAFLDQGIKISRSYTGKLDDIAIKVLKNHLDNPDIELAYAGNVAQSSIKVITPYISPLESAKWLLDRATEFSGAPYFLWQSIFDQSGGKQKLRIGDLESMMAKGGGVAWNENNPLVYSQSKGMEVALEDTIDQKYIIKEMTSNNVSDTMNTMADGAVGAKFSSVDTYTSQMYSRHFDSKVMLDQAGGNVMAGTKEQNVIDTEEILTYEGESKPINEWDHRYIDVITSYGTYGPWNSYHDDPQQLDALNKMRSRSFHSLLQKNPVEILVSGTAFWQTGSMGIGAGDITKVTVVLSEVHEPGSEEQPRPTVDENRSGHYLIKRCRHTFSNTVHNVSAQLVKLDKGDTSGAES